ncbi:MAG: 2-isopropylmalate synthase [Proteobacteria bacterium]|nr:MAG: 2-isopropylmalate synthase [Pseudomonadota bacterium]
MNSDYVRVFDTTLRDGEQSPGATMTSAEKLDVARAIARLGVDVIETGFPAASPDDWRAVNTIARQVGDAPVAGRPNPTPAIICGLARAHERDLERAWTAVEPAAHPRIHTFIATSPIHREHKLRMSKAEIVEHIRKMVGFARSRCEDIEFSCEDAGRTELDYLAECVAAAIEAGATTVNIPDTVGYTTPEEFGARIAYLKANVPRIDDVIISVHCHNDLGLATANTLAGLRAGARQAEVTINGIGERAGNTALEEVVMALHTRAPSYGLRTGVDTTQISRVSRIVSSVTGMNVQPNKAVVGANAFAHEAGIHQDGMLKHHATYEIMRPETVGAGASQLVLGKHSGRHAFQVRLEELGYPCDRDELDRAFARFKALADKKKHLTDADLEAVITSEIYQAEPLYTLDGMQVACGSMGLPTATVRLKCPDGATRVEAAVGTGPVDALFKAIDGVVRTKCVLLEYLVHGVTQGIDALGEVTVRIKGDAPTRRVHAHGAARRPVFHGHGADTDIIVASAKAYIAALNRLLQSQERVQPGAAEAGKEHTA